MRDFWNSCVKGLGLASGIAAVVIALYIISHFFSLKIPPESSYNEIKLVDVIMISLTSVTVILTVVVIGIAILAIFGWNTLRKISVETANEAAKKEFEKNMEEQLEKEEINL